MKKRGLLAILLDYAGDKKKYYFVSVLTAVISVASGIIPFYFVADIITKLINQNHDFSNYIFDIVMILVLFFVKGLFHVISTSLSHIAAFDTIKGVRKRATDSLALASLGDVKSENSGSLKNTLCERIDSTETTLAHVIPEVASSVLCFLATLVYLLIIDWRMGLISLIPVVIGIISYATMTIGYEKNYRICIEKTKILNDTAVEYINGIEVIKAFGKSESSYEKFEKAAREGASCFVEWMRQSNISFTIAMSVAPYTLLAILPFGGLLYLNGSLDLNVFVITVLMSIGLISPLVDAMGHADDISKAQVIFREIDRIVSLRQLTRPNVSKALPKD